MCVHVFIRVVQNQTRRSVAPDYDPCNDPESGHDHPTSPGENILIGFVVCQNIIAMCIHTLNNHTFLSLN